jgi:cytochrome c-type biogenesis protein CcmH
LDARASAIAAKLRCPVCQNESVADSPAQLAAQMRALIREQLAAGETDDQIIAYFVSKYGEWILLEPPRRGLLWLVWGAPIAALLAGAYLAANYVRRRVGPHGGSTSISSTSASTAAGEKKQYG